MLTKLIVILLISLLKNLFLEIFSLQKKNIEVIKETETRLSY